ncbi:hypothetical protein HOLleu_31884 [Holothuria leucospilota]|uniref:Uncharacterized protein n=1 Tax=Holothuria leucospilota TaxID=206669 RepID=A0A9Q1BGK6_HOLLE|nr:hypothetical protein HOLleu_31884 [Holothuria leucospilota]
MPWSSGPLQEGVKRFTYKGPNSRSSDDFDNFEKSRTPLQSTHRPNVSSSDMEVIWSVRKDNSGFNSKLSSKSPTPMSGFYSRYTSQDPRLRSKLGGNEKSDVAGVSGDYTYNSGKSGYSYSQGKMKMQPASEQPASSSNSWKQSQANHRNILFRDSSPTTPSPSQESGRFNIPSTSSDHGRHSSNSWDDFF